MTTRPLFTLFILLLFTLALTLASPASAAADEILLTEIVVTPTGGEFVEVHNPTAATVDLSDYYLTDATFAGGGTYYYNIVTGTNAGGGGFADFHARFPDGATIAPGEYQTIAMAGSDGFSAEYSSDPTYELFEDGGTPDAIPDMREALPGSINNQGGLTNSGEVVVLYFWDGQSDLVTDVDYALWGDKDEAVDKTGVSVDGPDADSDASSYLADTAIVSQDVLAVGAHSSGSSWQRDDLTEGTEISSGGNGVNGEDETSENLSETWCENDPTPGEASSCAVSPPVMSPIIVNEIMQNPSAVSDGAGEWFELHNTGDAPVDVNGWTIADNDFDSHLINNGGPLEIPAGGFLVLGNSADSATNGGVSVDYNYGDGLFLANGADEVVLFDGTGAEIDRVEYDGGFTFPDPNGASMALIDPTLDNNVGVNWCVSGPAFGDGDLGTPGAANECAPPPPAEACGDPFTPIYDIQGSGLASPLDGSVVSTEGVVVGDFQDNDGDPFDTDLDGFFIQDATGDGDPATSDGIFIFAPGSIDVQAGDRVRVAGEVDEFFDMTEITDVTTVLLCGSGPELSATNVSLPVSSTDDFEVYEGMLVAFPQQLYISEFFNFDRFGEIVLTTERQFQPTAVFEPGSPEAAEEATFNALSRITLDDGRTNQNPDPARHPNGNEFTLANRFRGGDIVQNVTGVLNFSFGLYRIQPTTGANYTAQNPRPDKPADVGGNITVAAFNVLNYFTSLDFIQESNGNDPTDDVCGPPGFEQECRGADTAEELTRQRDKIIAAIAAMDADVVGLIEIQNDDGTSTADLVSGLNDELGADTYDYINTGFIGTDAIKQAFIYQPASVTPVGEFAVLDTADFVDPNNLGDPKNRPALAQTFIDNETGGIFTAVVNHFKSKGSPCGPGDDDPEQGNCNLTRTLAAQKLADWLATDPTGSGDADFLIIGDLNSYDKEDPIDVLQAGADDVLATDDDYTDLLFHLVGERAYTFVFDGQLGYLDYGMANQELLPEVTGVTAWHINTDEPDILDYDTSFKQDAQDALYEPNAFRSSDHDPVIVGLDVCDEIAPTLDVTVTPDVLWPPDHMYVTVEATVSASDNFDPNPTVTLLSVTSNEPDNGEDDGDTINDIVIVDDDTFQLRAERSGIGTGRVYTITYQATDACGNSTTETATVTVPLSLEGGRGRQN